jgi:tripartite-type tricarboxylate transporter receptor subunit TctC
MRWAALLLALGAVAAEAQTYPAKPVRIIVPYPAGSSPTSVNKHLYKDLPYDPERDLLPVSLLAWAPQMLVVRPGIPAQDFRAFLTEPKR